MPRAKGSGQFGVVRSLRLPLEVDAWFEEHLVRRRDRAASQLLLELVHGGLRLRGGYMRRHYDELGRLIASGDRIAHDVYLQALSDTFGEGYVEHVLKWLDADRRVLVDNNAG